MGNMQISTCDSHESGSNSERKWHIFFVNEHSFYLIFVCFLSRSSPGNLSCGTEELQWVVVGCSNNRTKGDRLRQIARDKFGIFRLTSSTCTTRSNSSFNESFMLRYWPRFCSSQKSGSNNRKAGLHLIMTRSVKLIFLYCLENGLQVLYSHITVRDKTFHVA